MIFYYEVQCPVMCLIFSANTKSRNKYCMMKKLQNIELLLFKGQSKIYTLTTLEFQIYHYKKFFKKVQP